jgi:Xaa-Pro dipeptidase
VGEVDRRYALVRRAMAEHGIDALVVAGTEYTGFEGAVRYLSGFQIVHRYAYVLLPIEGDPTIVFPAEARYVGVHEESWIENQVFADHPGAWLSQRLEGKRVGVYGLDYVLPARDYATLQGKLEIVPFDEELDLARAVKSDAELESVRDSVRINT